MITVTLRPLTVNGKECIGIYFKSHPLINGAIRQHAGARWDPSAKAWWVLLSRENYNNLLSALQGKATVDQKEFIEHYRNRKKENKFLIPVTSGGKIIRVETERTIDLSGRIHPVNAHVLPLMRQQLILLAYSPLTIRTYLSEMAQLLLTLKNIPADELTPEHLRRYLVYCFEKLKLTENTVHSRINAMKFYYEQVLRREKFFWDIPRPNRPGALPKTFNQDEIAAIINGIKNMKHKVMLMIAYSAGLRVSEVVSLKTYDIDSKRMSIFIRQAKGKKDRIVSLSPVLLVMLREYALRYKPAKKGYLFEGNVKGTAYAMRSLQEVIQAAKARAGIIKPGSIHALRHSFATHLVDRGMDVTIIQKLLGHSDIKTTLRYLHTSNKDLLKIISPLDDLKLT
jgi:integrase/recombinase XerD